MLYCPPRNGQKFVLMGYEARSIKSRSVSFQTVSCFHIDQFFFIASDKSCPVEFQIGLGNGHKLIADVSRDVSIDGAPQFPVVQDLPTMVQDLYPIFLWIAQDGSLPIRDVSVCQIGQKGFRHAFRVLQFSHHSLTACIQIQSRICFDAHQIFPVCQSIGGTDDKKLVQQLPQVDSNCVMFPAVGIVRCLEGLVLGQELWQIPQDVNGSLPHPFMFHVSVTVPTTGR